MKRKIELSEF